MTRPTLPTIEAAARRIGLRLAPTPLIESPWLSEWVGAPIWLKVETLQPTRSFKVRGAVNVVERLHRAWVDSRETWRAPHLVTASAGNHGAALAWASERAGLPCTVITPSTAPATKRRAIELHGADLHAIADDYDDAERLAVEVARREGHVYVSPYNHPDVISGAGTIGLEILEQLPAVARIVVPLGGGGLLSGIAIAVRERRPDVQLLGVEARRSPAFSTSLRAGRITPVTVGPTLADGLAGNLEPDSITFAIINELCRHVLAIDEGAIATGIATLVDAERLVAEGAGAMAVAALPQLSLTSESGPTVAVVSGANIDLLKLAGIVDAMVETE